MKKYLKTCIVAAGLLVLILGWRHAVSYFKRTRAAAENKFRENLPATLAAMIFLYLAVSFLGLLLKTGWQPPHKLATAMF